MISLWWIFLVCRQCMIFSGWILNDCNYILVLCLPSLQRNFHWSQRGRGFVGSLSFFGSFRFSRLIRSSLKLKLVRLRGETL